MAALTLDQVLSYIEALSSEDQEILAELLKRRRVERWRQETSKYGREAVKKYRTRKLVGQSGASVIARLRKGLKKSAS